jgi:hypothetical protein
VADESADDRWTIRGVPKAVRDAAADAAQRRKVTVGVWLCEAVDHAIKAEREPLDLLVADKPADRSDALSDTGARLTVLERTIAAAVTLANARKIPLAFRKEANRLLRESLPSPTGLVSGEKVRLIAGETKAKANGADHDAG